MSKKEKKIKIAFIGDKGIGKSTFINNYVKSCNEQTQDKQGNIIITKEFKDRKFKIIISEFNEVADKVQAISDTQCVCIMFDMEDRNSFDNVLDVWLLWLRDTCLYQRPIIILGNYKNKEDDLLVDKNEIDAMIEVSSSKAKFIQIGGLRDEDKVKTIDELITQINENWEKGGFDKNGKANDKKCTVF